MIVTLGAWAPRHRAGTGKDYGRRRAAAFVRLLSLVLFGVLLGLPRGVSADPGKAKPAKAEPAKAESAKTDSPKPDSPKTDSPKTDSPKTDSPKTDSPKTDSPKPDSPEAEPAKADSPKTDSPKTEQAVDPTLASTAAQAPPGTGPCTDAPVIVGHGYHPFDKDYFLVGPNVQFISDHAIILEGEVSFVPFISDALWWLGFWGSVGAHFNSRENPVPEPTLHKLRAGGGVEAGYRFLAADVGYITDRYDHSYGPGARLRLGIAIATEMFSGDKARYRRDCCLEQNSATACECDRNPVGMSFFLYGAFEGYLHPTVQPGPMLGLSAKVALGL